MKHLNCYTKERNKVCFFTLKKINIGLFCFLLVVSFSYIVLANSITVKGFMLRDLRAQLSSLSEENRSLETNLMTMKSYGSIYSKVENLNMVAIGDVNYIKPLDSSVAKR